MFTFSSFSPACRLSLLVCAFVWAGFNSPAVGADSEWTGGGGIRWSREDNWTNGVPGAYGTTDNQDTATIGVSEFTEIYLDNFEGPYNIKNLRFVLSTGEIVISPFDTEFDQLYLTSGGAITVEGYTPMSGDPLGPLQTVTISIPQLVIQSDGVNGSYTFSNTSTNTANQPNPRKLLINSNISGGEASGQITLNLTGSTGSRTRSVAESNEITGSISDGDAAGGLTVVVSGTGAERGAWNLSGSSSYTGKTLVTSGTLFFSSLGLEGQESALGAGKVLEARGGSFLMYTGGAMTTDREVIIGAGGASWFNSGTGALTLNVDSTLQLNGATLTLRGTQDFIVDGLITGTGTNTINRTDGGTVYFNNVNNSFGLGTGINISTGAFNAKSIANIGEISAIGRSNQIGLGQNNGGTGAANNIGTFILNSATGGTTDRAIRINNGTNTSGSITAEVGGGVISNAVAGTRFTLNGNVTIANQTTKSTFELAGAGNGVLAGAIVGTPKLDFTKSGNGTWEIRTANSYTGVTTISGGTLLVTNTTGSATGTGNVAVGSAGTLGGTGRVTSGAGATINVASGGRVMIGNTHGIALGQSSAADYVATASRLDLGSNANVGITLAGTLQFDLFGTSDGLTPGASDVLGLHTTAASITLGGTISVADMTGTANWRATGGTGFTGGVWQLIDWSGIGAATKSGVFSYSLATSSLGIGYTWDTGTVLTDGNIRVVQIADANIHRWTGNFLNTNDAGADEASWANVGNWTAGTATSASTDVIFANATATKVTLNGDRRARNILFTGESNYNISSGSGGGVLYVHGDATNGGTIQTEGGIQNINTNVRFGDSSSNLYIINNSVGDNGVNTLIFGTVTANDFDSGANITDKLLTISGAGNTLVSNFERRHSTYDLTLVKNGSGTLTINGANNNDAGANSGTFTGTTTINEGTIRINNERALGGQLTKAAAEGGVPLAFNAAHLTLNGGTLGAFGTFAIDDAHRGITLGVNGGGFDVEGGTNTLTIANVITGVGSLRKTNAGTLRLTAANTYAGDTLVQLGTLNVGNTSGSATGFGSVFVNGASMLSGAGAVAGKAGGVISIGSQATLRIGNNHNSTSGVPSLLTLGGDYDVGISLEGTLQFDIFRNDSGLSLLESDRLALNTTADSITLGGLIQVAGLGNEIWAGGTWQLIDWSGVDFDNTALIGDFTFDFSNANGRLATGFTWNTDNFLTDGTISIVATENAYVWTGDGGDNSWKNPDNWLAGAVPTQSVDVVFQGGGSYPQGQNTIVTDAAPTGGETNQYVRNIFFTGEKNYTVNIGTGVIFAHGNRLEVQGGTQTINAQVRPMTSGNYTIHNDGTLTFLREIMAGTTVNVIFDGAGDTTLPTVSRRNNQVINLVKNGTGTVTFTSANVNTGVPDFTASGAYIKGTTTINQGKIRINQEGNLGGNPDAFNAAHLHINGGTLSAYADVVMDDENRGVTLGANHATFEVERVADTFRIDNVITGVGKLNKTGVGTLELRGNNTYSGDTILLAGVLLANNAAGSATGSGNVRTLADSGAVLGGTGIIAGGGAEGIHVATGTSLRVGATHGTFVGGAQDLQLGNGGGVNIALNGSLQFDIFGAGSFADLGDESYNSLGTANDLLEIHTTGSLDLQNALVHISVQSTLDWLDGQMWKLIDWSELTPSSVVTEGISLANVSFDGFTLQQIIRSDGYYVMAIVPEPGRAMLLMTGVLWLALRRRRMHGG
jgi:autotransporter-associated beta strand protein